MGSTGHQPGWTAPAEQQPHRYVGIQWLCTLQNLSGKLISLKLLQSSKPTRLSVQVVKKKMFLNHNEHEKNESRNKKDICPWICGSLRTFLSSVHSYTRYQGSKCDSRKQTVLRPGWHRPGLGLLAKYQSLMSGRCLLANHKWHPDILWDKVWNLQPIGQI